ncbi:MAG TPA: sugar transferase, partial [Pirellulaceae bacterium]
MWDLVDQWRIAAPTHDAAFALIEVNLEYLATARQRDEVVLEIQRYAAENWIHQIEEGWMGARTFGTLLPNAACEDGLAYAEQMARRIRIPRRQIQLYVSGCDTSSFPRTEGGITVRTAFERMVCPEPRLKRGIDLVLGTLLFLLCLPVLVAAGLLIRLTSAGPAFFRQQRLGRGGRPFWIYKLRTMRHGAEHERPHLDHRNEQSGSAFKMARDPRITTVGSLLRKTSIDELPQLINVILGDMSLVGPRPLPASDWKPAEGWQNLRHDVKPGMTCTWQIAGRMEI